MNFPITSANVAFGPTCLVTGGAGFLGETVVKRLLELGLTVRSFDVAELELKHPKLTQIKGDIRNAADLAAACAGVDAIFHTAAMICLLGTYRREVRERVWSINVVGTELLLQAAKQNKVKVFAHTSSHNVCMDREMHAGDESEAYAQRYIDLYTETKVAAEKAVLAANGPSLKTAAVRPGGIWGPSKRSVLINKTMDEVVAGRFVALAGGTSVLTDCSHVENVADGLILAAQKLVTDPQTVGGQAYFINDGEPMNQLLWSKSLIEGLGYKFPTVSIPAAPLALVAWVLEWLHYFGAAEPSLTRSAIWKLSHNYYHKIDKARRELGYNPRFNLNNSLAAVLPFAKAYADALTQKSKKAA